MITKIAVKSLNKSVNPKSGKVTFLNTINYTCDFKYVYVTKLICEKLLSRHLIIHWHL